MHFFGYLSKMVGPLLALFDDACLFLCFFHVWSNPIDFTKCVIEFSIIHGLDLSCVGEVWLRGIMGRVVPAGHGRGCWEEGIVLGCVFGLLMGLLGVGLSVVV